MALKSASPAAIHILEDIGLDDLPTDWTIIRLEDLLSDTRGISVGVMYPGNHDPFGIPLIRAGDLAGNLINPQPEFFITRNKHGEYRRTELTGGELLISLVGEIGRCAVVPSAMAGWNAARAIAVLRFSDASDALFVRLCLMSSPLQHLMQAWATTTVQATLNLKEIRQLPLPWPPQKERRALTNTIQTLEDKIELNRRMNETLEAIARAIFKSWFVDFDPVHAKSQGRQPFGMDADTAALFPNSFEDSPVGKMPKDWKIAKFGEIAENPRRVVSPADVPPETPYIGLEHMPRKSISLASWGRSGEVTSGKSAFKAGEILFGKLRPYFHKVGVAPLDGVCSTDILVIRPKSPEWFGIALEIASSQEFVDHADGVSTGTKMPRTNWHDMARYEICLPKEDLAGRFSAVVKPLVDKIRGNIHESLTLADLRDTLLPKLISGEIRIKDADRMVEESL